MIFHTKIRVLLINQNETSNWKPLYKERVRSSKHIRLWSSTECQTKSSEVIAVYPGILLEASNYRLKEGRFFDNRKRLVLLRKGEKPLEDAIPYRPICLLDTMEKHLEKVIIQRLQSHVFGDSSLPENQFGFRRGWSSPLRQEEELVNVRDSAR